jgi:hypothetical protein
MMKGAFYNNNLDYTVGKYNNPYLLIQKAGKTRARTRTRRFRKTRRTRRTRRR